MPTQSDHDADAILEGLQGRLPHVPVSLPYKLGLSVVALAMILLPMVYLGIIALTCWAIHWHAVSHTGIFEGVSRPVVALMVYLAPIVVGGLLVLFMIKPLFAKAAPPPPYLVLREDKEPALCAFVYRICDLVGAPRPSEIRVDREVNASASFRRGIFSMFGNDLVLTIGLPLAAGLNTRQLAGVLAHEFGHFAQGAGMRLTYIIRSINGWFYRVAYERDSWDETLAEWSSELDLRIGIVLYLARFFIWLTRLVLKLLMYLGHVISCFMLRQMEFDADTYEAHLAGSEVFAQTMKQVTLLGAASQLAHNDLGSAFQEGRLVDRLPEWIVAKRDSMPEQVRKKVDQHIRESKTGLFDTHPADHDRVRHTAQLRAAGIFQIELPNEALFTDFAGISRKVTLQFYSAVLETRLQRATIVPLDEMLEREGKKEATRKALSRFFQGAVSILRPLPDMPPIDPAFADAEAATRELADTRERMVAALPAYRSSYKTYEKADDAIDNLQHVSELLKCGLKVNARDFDLPATASNNTVEARRKFADQKAQFEAQLATFETLGRQRLRLALALLRDPGVRARVPDADARLTEAEEFIPVLNRLAQHFPKLLSLRNDTNTLTVLGSQLEGNDDNQKLVDRMLKLTGKMRSTLTELSSALEHELYPMDHTVKDITLKKYAIPMIPQARDLGNIMEASGEAFGKLVEVYFRMLGRIAATAEAVEGAVGLKPLPDPPENDEKNGAEDQSA